MDRHRMLYLLHLGGRVVCGSGALIAIALSATSSEERWQKTIDIVLATAVVLAASTNTRHWSTVRGLVGGATGLFLAMSGVVAGLSIDEALALVSGALVLGGFAWFLGRPERREANRRAEATLAALESIRAELAVLRVTLTS